jgi:hypothetical protein
MALAARMQEDLAAAEAAERAKEEKKAAEKLRVAQELQRQMAEKSRTSASAGVSE